MKHLYELKDLFCELVKARGCTLEINEGPEDAKIYDEHGNEVEKNITPYVNNGVTFHLRSKEIIGISYGDMLYGWFNGVEYSVSYDEESDSIMFYLRSYYDGDMDEIGIKIDSTLEKEHAVEVFIETFRFDSYNTYNMYIDQGRCDIFAHYKIDDVNYTNTYNVSTKSYINIIYDYMVKFLESDRSLPDKKNVIETFNVIKPTIELCIDKLIRTWYSNTTQYIKDLETEKEQAIRQYDDDIEYLHEVQDSNLEEYLSSRESRQK